MFTLKHPFEAQQADGVDPTLVKPSDWNEQHVLDASTSGVFIGRTAAGPGPMAELPISAVFPPGMIIAYAGVTAPTGWLACSGQVLLIATYPALFAAIGIAYGGNGTTNFNAPDLRGRVIVSPDSTGLVIPGATIRGAVTGVSSQTVSVTGNISVTGSALGVSGTIDNPPVPTTIGNGTGATVTVAVPGNTISGNTTTTVSANGANTLSTSSPVSIVQPTLAIPYLIKT